MIVSHGFVLKRLRGILRNAVVPLLSLVAAALSAEGRFGVNISDFSPNTTEFIYVDICKSMQLERIGSGFTVAQFDSNGYPLSLGDGQTINLGFGSGTDHVWPAGEYHIFFDGEGTLTGRTSCETLKQTVANGHQIWTINHSNEWFGFSITATTSGNHLRNLRIIMPGFQDIYQSDPIHPTFRRHWSGMKAVRFMDWSRTNASPVVNWSQVTPAGYLSMAGYIDEPGKTRFAEDPTGGSPELAADLCNAMNMDMWFCIPHKATDDCILKFAQCIKNRLKPTLKVYLEYSNECWNWAGGFTQTGYCRDKGVELGLTTDGPLEYYVYRSGQMFKIWEDAWGVDKSRVVNVFAWQSTTSNPEYWINKAINEWYASTTYNPAGIHPEYYANAPYIHDQSAGTPATVNELFAGIDEDLTNTENIMRSQKNFADANGLEYGCYEAGQHYSSYGTSQTLENTVYIPANRDARMKTAYDRYLSYWKNSIGGLMMLYSSMSTYSVYGSWGLLERYDQDITTSPKYLAVRDILGIPVNAQFHQLSPAVIQQPNIVKITGNQLVVRSNDHGPVLLYLYDAQGKLVTDAFSAGKKLDVSLDHLARGVYIARGIAGDQVHQATFRKIAR
jgi:hypothetical protein